MSQNVIAVISKPPESRTQVDVDLVVPWLKKKSGVLQGLENVVFEAVVKGCDYRKCQRDQVVIRQGEKGDCFFIILAGSVSVYIDGGRGAEEESLFTDESSSPEPKPTHNKGRRDTLDRTLFGKFIISFDAGKSFGEIALMSEDSVRNATIITDETTHFLVIHRDLYNNTLKTHQEKEFRDRRAFARSVPYFSKWSRHSQRLLEMSIIREIYSYDQPIIRQGEPWRGLIFIRRGKARITVEPSKHPTQYPNMYPFIDAKEAGQVQISSKKKKKGGKVRRPRSHADVRQDQVFVRRKIGYAAAEQRLQHRQVNVCHVGEGETIGDVEIVSNMNTYMQTVVCTSETEVYILTIKNFERLIPRKNPGTMDSLRRICKVKLSSRLEALLPKKVPLFGHLLYKLTLQLRPESVRKIPPVAEASFKDLPEKEELFNHMLTLFVRNKAQICDPHVPGSVYYRDIMREKARIRESIRQHRNIVKSKRPVWYATKRSKAHPRSIKSIRAALERQQENNGDQHQIAIMHELRALEELELQTEYQNKADELKDKLFLMGPGFAKDSVRLPAIEDSTEPQKPKTPEMMYGEAVSQPEDKRPTTSKVINDDFSLTEHAELLERTKTFLTELAPDNDTRSNPEVTSPIKEEFQQDGGEGARPVSVAGHREAEDEADGSLSSAPSSTFSQKEHLRYLQAEAKRKMRGNDETPAYRDWETSEKSLNYLEKRLQDFRPTAGERYRIQPVTLPKLKRFEAGDAQEQPRPGGRVMVRRRACALSQSKYKVIDHEHTRYHMVPAIQDYDNLKKTKRLLHMVVDDARSKWIKVKGS